MVSEWIIGVIAYLMVYITGFCHGIFYNESKQQQEEETDQMVSFEKQQEVLHSPFNVKTHKKTFVSYLEICIDPDGIIHYAIPSHYERLLSVYLERENISRDELMKRAFEENDSHTLEKCMDGHALCNELGWIAVWEDHYIGTANENQIRTLKMLTEENLYAGEISMETNNREDIHQERQ